MRKSTLLILTLASFCFCKAQKRNSLYYGVSSDSLRSGHQLLFTTDSTLEISSFPRHMSQQFTLTLTYLKCGNSIKTFPKILSQKDSQSLIKHGLTQFLSETSFALDKKAILDTASKMVYVLYKDFSSGYFLTYIIDGKIYQQETGLPDAYGLVKNNPKENRALTAKLASINNSLDNYTGNVYKGLDAYKKFGYDKVFGVIVLTQKN